MQRYILYLYHMLLLAAALLAQGCDLIDYHPYEGKTSGEANIIARNVPLIEQRGKGRETFRFAVISDTQRHYDDTEDVVNELNARTDIDFVLHAGDMTDFGLTDEFEWMRDRLVKIRLPWVCVLGNHDTLGNGEHIYQKLFGAYNYGFTFGHVRFECINTNALEFETSANVPDISFLISERQLVDSINVQHPDSITRTIFLMHSRPDDEQFNANVAVLFEYRIREFPGMKEGQGFCINGHNHHYEILEPFGDGTLYYGAADIHKRNYLLFTIYPDGKYEHEQVFF